MQTGSPDQHSPTGSSHESSRSEKKICFLALRAYPLLAPDYAGEYMGGAEKKIVAVARGLAERGHRISLLTYAEHGSGEETLQGMRVVKTFSKDSSMGFLRKNLVLWRTLRMVDADVYVFSSGFLGPTSLYCLLHRKRYYYWLGSDRAAELKTIGAHTSILEKILMYLSIRLSTAVIVQNFYQQQKIDARRKRTVLINNPIDLPPAPVDPGSKRNNVIWVGQIKRIKQPVLFVDLARNFPDQQFILIGGDEAAEKDIEESLSTAIRGTPNLVRLGYVPHQQILSYYQRAMLLVNTSTAEGFPNTFLEAWISGTPVVSLYADPDEVICRYGLGFHSRSFSRLIEDVRSLLSNPGLRQEIGNRGQEYVLRHHTIDQAVSRFEGMIDET